VVVLPKVSTPEPIHAVTRGIAQDIRLWAMIESCMGLIRMPDIAGASKTTGLAGLLVGTNDLAAEMRCHAGVDRHALIPALSQVVITARAWGLTPVSRLSCQAKVGHTKLVIEIPKYTINYAKETTK